MGQEISYVRNIIEWACNNDFSMMLITICMLIVLILYVFFSMKMKLSDRKTNTQKFTENNGRLKILAHSFQTLSDNVEVLKQKSNVSQLPYETLTSVYDLEVGVSKVKDDDLINFLYSKLLEIVKITNYAILIHSLIVSGKVVNTELILTNLDHHRKKIIESCISNLGSEFSKTNSHINEEIFSESKSVLITILEDKKKNDKIKRIIEAAKKMLAKTMRATISEHEKFIRENKPNSDCNFNIFDKFISEGKLHEAVINLLNCEYERKDVLLLIGRITIFETKKIQGLIGSEKEKIEHNLLCSNAMDLKTKIQKQWQTL